ncbi:nuclear transport factor 2 family protein [Streptomyces sp. NPDC021212]|uniref:nuclear transport factor 2 family protein n=1 Tax=Streptomyces sp. NPDC021212 TaxID=3365118 RepID=UPI0037A673C5
MNEHPDCALVRRAYQLFTAGDLDALSALMTADVTHHVPGDNQRSGHYKGLDECVRLYRDWGRPDGSSKSIDLETLITDGRGRVVSVHRYTARNADGSRSFSMKAGNIFTLVGGKISDIDECVEDLEAFDAYWR